MDLSKVNNHKISRRDFLKYLGFSTALTGLASCEKPIEKAIPYLIKPEEIQPNTPYFYATSFYNGQLFTSLLTKNINGRPIKLEYNNLIPTKNKSVSAIVQASLLELYDTKRLQSPYLNQNKTNWKDIDTYIHKSIDLNRNKTVRFLSNTIISPTTKQLISNFGKQFSNFKHIEYDSILYDSIRLAYQKHYNKAIIPFFNIHKANVIACFDADFLTSYINNTDHTHQYGQFLKNPQHTHYHFEALHTPTGEKADYRATVSPKNIAFCLYLLYQMLNDHSFDAAGLPKSTVFLLQKTAKHLRENPAKSIVICGQNNYAAQFYTLLINKTLKNVGNTIDIENTYNLKNADSKSISTFLNELISGKIDMLFIDNINLIYEFSGISEIKKQLKNISKTVYFTQYENETSEHCHCVCAKSHFLESWHDFEPINNNYYLAQPTINHFFNTRQMQTCLLRWQNLSNSYYNYLQAFWKKNIFALQTKELLFESFWNKSVHDGFFIAKNVSKQTKKCLTNTNIPSINFEKNDLNYCLQIFTSQKSNITANCQNPWLEELPDAITQQVWGNCFIISNKIAETFSLKSNETIKITTTNSKTLTAPVFISNNQHDNTIGIAAGFGFKNSNTGINTNNALSLTPSIKPAIINIIKIEKNTPLPFVQLKSKLKENKHLFTSIHTLKTQNKLKDKTQGKQWGMCIDISKCIGCGACITSCQVENNIPVVGIDECQNNRQIHWIQIAHYSLNNKKYYVPIMCQHCQNAPCEPVCPVYATSHSKDGINQMTYARCIGTRFCATNCPYEVRRFNWFDYSKKQSNIKDNNGYSINSMVLNPDVTVRSKGVIEKCSLCVQRIKAKEIVAKSKKQPLKDNDIETACSAVCPVNAITFGNIADKTSQIYNLRHSPKAYILLAKFNTNPSVFYLLPDK